MKLQSTEIKYIANMCTPRKLQNEGWASMIPEHSLDSKEKWSNTVIDTIQL